MNLVGPQGEILTRAVQKHVKELMVGENGMQQVHGAIVLSVKLSKNIDGTFSPHLNMLTKMPLIVAIQMLEDGAAKLKEQVAEQVKKHEQRQQHH